MARNNGLDPNAGMSPKEDDMGAAVQELDSEKLAEVLAERQKIALADRALDSTMTLGEADAKRETPRPRTDSLDERFARRIPSDNVIRRSPSSRLKKRLSKQKQGVLAKQPRTRRNVIRQFTNGTPESREKLEGLNQALAATHGEISVFDDEGRESIRRLDRAISDYERSNAGVATVYAPVIPPNGMTFDELSQRFSLMAENKSTMTFDRYLIADHSINNATANTAPSIHKGDGPPLVFEYETSRGMYLGGSDSVDNGTHIVARSNTVEILGVKTITVERKDGTTYDQRVVQVRDSIDPELRTTAK